MIRTLINQVIDVASFIRGFNEPGIWEAGWAHSTARELVQDKAWRGSCDR